MKKNRNNQWSSFLEPNSLRYQLLSRSLFILSGLLLLIGMIQYLLMEQFLYRSKAESLLNLAVTLPYQVLEDTETLPKNDQYVSALLSLHTPDIKYAFIDNDANVTELFTNPSEGYSPRFPESLYREILASGVCTFKYKILEGSTGTDYLVVLAPIRSPDQLQGIVQLSTPVGSMREVLFPQLIIFFSASALALLIGLLTYVPVLRRTLNPLSRIEVTVERINAGNLDERLPMDQGQMEIDQLSAVFNGMLERLETSFKTEQEAGERMRRFVADASHELRTPLTSIHGFLEVLLRGAAANPEHLQKALKSMHGETERLNKLVNDLLYLARMDREPAFLLQEGQLDAVVHSMESQLLVLAGDRNVHFRVEPNVTVAFDCDGMKQVILNLFQNAVQHTDSVNGEIGLTLGKIANGIELTIKDNGVGIAPEHVPHVFDRFYRIESSRARKSGGAGLGLSITQSIVENHRGKIDVQSSLGTGTVFRVWLPNGLKEVQQTEVVG
ncbi:HAMP domain-containing protein [Brevibacillus sp. HB1.3]|uniref:sensor histidine kinase n=1 Tax=Brevibacillus sp. HB1.3 TaxID=2738842 RepID=UPI001553155B|nr:HAMP domain-containing sensor histidine kinase [Brevibacillus sp. HB1.3]NQF16161.1 HAMP domain-containing protein [Brevibacillus sp. HB1.3]